MPYSMTGFGRGEAQGSGYRLTVELKAVNHRFLEIVVRLPRAYGALEEKLRQEVQQRIQRGRIEALVNVAETEERKKCVKVDKDLATSYDKILKDLSAELGVAYQPDPYRLVALPEVLAVEEAEADMDLLTELGRKAVRLALDGLVAMRESEGDKLAADIRKRFQDMDGQIEQVAARAERVVSEYQERLRERIQSLLAEIMVDESKLANEAAYFADRASITEELVRLRSHAEQGRQTLAGREPAGRKLDFLMQEMNRETNTIGAKANDLLISQAVVCIKSELEKIREQIQNLE
ncbi:MAG: YicC family protein [Peptococcaceae bacterium]|nr:YicC family protein [Peptococcaceae bacterium]